MKVKNQYLKILEYLHLSFNKWPSLQYKFWVCLVLWNHNNGEDCWVGNDPEDEHWHPPQRGPRVWRKSGEAQNPCCLKSSVKFPQSVMIWAAMSSAGVGPLCFLKSTVNAAIYQEILEHFMLPSADKLYGDADFIFQQDLAPAHTAKCTKSWFNDHGVTVLDWPANSPDLNPIENHRESMVYCQEEDERHQTQQCRGA